MTNLFCMHNEFEVGTCTEIQGSTLTYKTSQRLVKFQFRLVDFELPLAIKASKYCEAVEFWTKTKMKIICYG